MYVTDDVAGKTYHEAVTYCVDNYDASLPSLNDRVEVGNLMVYQQEQKGWWSNKFIYWNEST